MKNSVNNRSFYNEDPIENTDDPDKIFATDRDVIACYWFVSRRTN
jgi:hypothetical protein